MHDKWENNNSSMHSTLILFGGTCGDGCFLWGVIQSPVVTITAEVAYFGTSSWSSSLFEPTLKVTIFYAKHLSHMACKNVIVLYSFGINACTIKRLLLNLCLALCCSYTNNAEEISMNKLKLKSL